jgi:oligopeptide transport system ATP-binding protein
MNSTSEARHLLEVKDLSVSASAKGARRELIHQVSFTVCEKEILAVLGESGSGKTILSRSLTKLFPATSTLRFGGSVMFEGQELFNLNEKELAAVRRRGIRYVFQEPMQSLNPLSRIGHQMRMASDSRSINDEVLHDTLTLVGLENSEEVLHRYPHELSIGMAQRVCIAMAVLPSPSLLIADEPTSAVDPSLRRKILDLLISLHTSRSMSLILITHDLDVAQAYGERIIVMYAGEIVESALRKDFFERPLHPYAQLLVDAQNPAQQDANPLSVAKEPDIAHVPPHGCSFLLMCPRAGTKCERVRPELEQLPGNREVRCFYWR